MCVKSSNDANDTYYAILLEILKYNQNILVFGNVTMFFTFSYNYAKIGGLNNMLAMMGRIDRKVSGSVLFKENIPN